MNNTITNETFKLVKALYPKLKTKKQVLDTFCGRDIDTGEQVMLPVPVSLNQSQTELLEAANDKNRAVSSNSTYQFKKALEEGKFYRTGDCLMITKDGHLVNGGCRVTSFNGHVKDNPTARLKAYMLLEVSKEVVLVSDQSRKRSPAAQAKLAEDLDLDKFMSGVVKQAAFGCKTYNGMTRINLGMTEYVAYATPRLELLRQFSGLIRAFSNRSGLDKQSVHRALYLIYIHESGLGEEFINAFYTSKDYNSLREDIRDKVLADNPLMSFILRNAYYFMTGKSGSQAKAVEYFTED